LHYLIHQVDARQKHPATTVASEPKLIEHATRALALYDPALEFLVLIAEQFAAGESNGWVSS
jgi:hypothetical protein